MIVPENSREFLNQSDSRLKTNRNQVTCFRGLFTLSLWYFYSLWQNNFRLSAASNPRLLWFSFTSLCEWSRKLTPISYTITCHHVTWSSALPVLLTIRLFFLEFSSYSDDVSICFRQSVENCFIFLWSTWLLRLFPSWFHETQTKCTLHYLYQTLFPIAVY